MHDYEKEKLMGKVVGLVVALWGIVAKYPALSAGLANIIIVAGAQVGLHLSTAELASIAGAAAALFGVLVTAGVIPVTKVANVKAGLGNKVPDAGAILVGTGAVVTAPEPPEPVTYTPTEPVPVLTPEPVSEPVSPKPEPKPFDAGRLGSPVKPFPKEGK